jgi:Ca2+-binding EF-hand superfamily protein
MSLTEKQKAYHLRKMRTCTKRFDTDKDGYYTIEDVELMSERLKEYGKLTNEQAERARQAFMKYGEMSGLLKPGNKIPVDELAQKMSEVMLSMSANERKAMLHATHEIMFDVIDLNKDGHISLEEFKVHFRVLGANVSDEEVLHTFNTIDTDKNGEISREEFMAAADDFYNGVEETEVSRIFFGHLED